ncbi:hypothetical protein DEO72_LG10g2217 [Vigna unguiculata]|uniref:Uncharacterized protein n=1 Tax=Vigna unguiculata TaxID=3917 RepID=A0A4D6NE21_VIGUN|nr:hypothetical protein DEO72_LG10g2217 [Vigna unguiculata]
MPTKGLVRVYNSVHPIIDIKGHMAQLGKKNLTLFQTLRKEKAVKAKAAGNTMVPNLQDSLVDVHVHGGSANGVKGPKAGLIELPKTTVRKDIEINVPESLINSIDNMEPKALEGSRTKVEELQEKVDKDDEEKEAWKKDKEEWEVERKRHATWRVQCLDSEEKLKGRIVELEADYDDIKEKHDGMEDVIDGVLIDEAKSSPEGDGVKDTVDAYVGDNEVVTEEAEQKEA